MMHLFERDRLTMADAIQLTRDSLRTHAAHCKLCQGSGRIPNGPLCPACQGRARFVRPSIVELNGGTRTHYLAIEEYDRLASIDGVEWHPVTDGPSTPTQSAAPLRFRFPEGVGLLMTLDPLAVQQRIKEARNA